MTVAETVTLPSQPASGSTTFLPLGGDGWTAPMSAYGVAINLAGDASGGNSTITLEFDPQYVSVLNYVSGGIVGSGVDLDVGLVLRTGAENVTLSLLLPESLAGGILASNTVLWTPPLLLLDPGLSGVNLQFSSVNVDGDSNFLNCRVYNFRRGVAQRTPLDKLIASMPRASGVIISPQD